MHRLFKLLHRRQVLTVLTQAHDLPVPHIGGKEDDRVAEVNETARTVLHTALVEALEEHLVHVVMGLLDFIEKHHAVGTATPRPHRSPRNLAALPESGYRYLPSGHSFKRLNLRLFLLIQKKISLDKTHHSRFEDLH